MNVLMLTDFSNHASHAHRYALSLYENQAVQTFLLHVKKPCLTSEKCSGKCKLGLYQKLVAKANELVSEAYPEAATPILSEGSFIEEVRTAVAKYKIDLVVIGAKGKTANAEHRLGSHPQAIATKIKCPSLIVFENTPIQPPTSALFPVNYTDALYPVCLNKLKTLPTWKEVNLIILELTPHSIANHFVRSSKKILEDTLDTHKVTYIDYAETQTPLIEKAHQYDLLIFAAKNLSVGNQIFSELKNHTASQLPMATPLFVLHA